MAAVLITVCDGMVDFCTDADPALRVALVNLDQYDEPGVFPEAADIDIQSVTSLPNTVPWKRSILRRLATARKALWDRLGVPPYGDEHFYLDGEDDDENPRSDAR